MVALAEGRTGPGAQLLPYLEIMYSIGMQDIPATGMTRLNGLLANTDDWALFIDIDGTLLDMAPTPDAVRVPPGLVQTLTHLAESFSGAVALITGRRIADAEIEDLLAAASQLFLGLVEQGREVGGWGRAGSHAAMLAQPAGPTGPGWG